MIKSFRIFLALALVMLGAVSVKGQEQILVENTEPQKVLATLVHTASSYCETNASAYISTVDAEKEHLNNSKFSGTWQGAAYAEFSVLLPEGISIKSATLTWSGIGSGKDRTTDIMYVNAGETLDYETMKLTGTEKVNLPASNITTVTFKRLVTNDFTTNVTEAVKAIVASGQNYIIFKFTNNVGGGDLVGKGAAEKAPVLTLEIVDASEMTSYTVKYVDGTGAELKAADVYSIFIGETASVAAENKVAIYNADNTEKYIYVSCDKENITTVADSASNVITATFREATKYNYSVEAVDESGNLITALYSDSNFEGESLTVPYNAYVLNKSDSTLYQSARNYKEYNQYITLTQNNMKVQVAYTKSTIENVVYYQEAENVEGLTKVTTGNTTLRSSNSASAYAAENDVVLTTLAPGKYKMTAIICDATSALNSEFCFIAGAETVMKTKATSPNWSSSTSEEFTLIANTALSLAKGGNEKQAVDFVYIQKTGDVTVRFDFTAYNDTLVWVNEVKATLNPDDAIDAEVIVTIGEYIVSASQWLEEVIADPEATQSDVDYIAQDLKTQVGAVLERGRIMKMWPEAEGLRAEADSVYASYTDPIDEAGLVEALRSFPRSPMFVTSVEELQAAMETLKAAMEALIVENENVGNPVALTADLFKEWDKVEADAQVIGDAVSEMGIGKELGAGAMIFGSSLVDPLKYADLTAYDKIVIEGTPGMVIRFLMNRELGGELGNFYGALIEVNPVIGEDGKAEVDLTAYDYVHLNAIKLDWRTPVGTITNITLENVETVLISAIDSLNTLIVEVEEFQKALDLTDAMQAEMNGSLAQTITASKTAAEAKESVTVVRAAYNELYMMYVQIVANIAGMEAQAAQTMMTEYENPTDKAGLANAINKVYEIVSYLQTGMGETAYTVADLNAAVEAMRTAKDVFVKENSPTTEVVVTLVHTASSYCETNQNVYTSTVDAEKEHLNNSKFSGTWQGAAYAEFSVLLPESISIKSATLAWAGIGSSKKRTTDIMYVNAGETLDYETMRLTGTEKVNLPATTIGTVTFPANVTTDFTTDVTEAVKAIIGTGQNYIIFKFTNNVGGGDLVGKGAAEKAPVLTLETEIAEDSVVGGPVSLTADLFKEWDKVEADAQVIGDAVSEMGIGKELGAGAMIFGSSLVDPLKYADLTAYDKIVIEGTPGMVIRFLMNRELGGEPGIFSGALVEAKPTIGEDGKAEVDLTAYNYVHLNAIKLDWGTPVGTITNITLENVETVLISAIDSLNTLIDEVKAYQETLDLTIPTQQMVHDTLTKEIETAGLIAETADTIPEIRYAYTNLYSAYATAKIHLAKFEADAARAYPGTGGLIGRIYEIAEYMPIMGSGYTLSDLDAAVQELRELVESLKVNVTGIYLDYDFLSMNRDDVMEISATVYPTNATDRTVTWYSSDESVATVNNGIVTAVGWGEAYVIACAGVYADTCVVSVWEDMVQNRISLQKIPFYSWDGWDGSAVKIGKASCEWGVGTSNSMVYGDPMVVNYADLSSYSKLILTVTEGAPRVLINRLKEEGQGGDTFEDSNLIDIPNWSWCTSKYQSVDGTVYVYDLKQITEDYGFCHLHAIKGANWSNVTVESAILERDSDTQPVGWINLVTNGDLENKDVSCFVAKEGRDQGFFPATILDGIGVDGSRGIVVTSPAGAANDFDAQFWIVLPQSLPAETRYRVAFDCMATKNVTVPTQSHAAPGTYIHYNMIGAPSITTEWQTHYYEGIITEEQAGTGENLMQSIAFNLAIDKENDVDYYFDNIKFEIYKAGSSPLIEDLKLKIEEMEAWRSSLSETDTIRMMVIENAEYLIQTAEVLMTGQPTVEELEEKIQEFVSFMDSYPEMLDTYDAALEAIRIAEELMAAHPEINSTSLVSYKSRLERELKAYGLNRVSRVQSYTRSLNSRIESFRNSLNYFTIPNVEARLYEPFTVPVSMTNDEEITAFQCDIYLYGDLEMNLNDEGDYDIKLNADRATSSHTVASELQADGAIRVIVYSNGSKLFKGNSGELFTIGLTALSAESPVDTVTGISVGVSVQNIRLSTSDEREILIADVGANVTVKTYTPADVNGDGAVSIVDVVAVVNNILGRNAGNFVFEAADMDQNGEITIVDVVAVVNVLLGKDVQAQGARSLLRSDIHVADAEVNADGTATFYVKLDNAQAYTAMQMDVDLPEGLDIEGVKMVGCPAHTVVFNEEGRIAAYSLNNSRFNPGESLMAITVKADADFAGNALVGFTNVRVVSTNVQETLLSDILANIAGGGATGIDGVLANGKVQILYYSTTGAVSDKPHKGLNVIKRICDDGRVEVSKEVCE